MKFRHIILIISTILVFCSCSMEEKPTADEIKDFNLNYYKWVTDYEFEKNKLEKLQNANLLRKKTAHCWNIYKDTTRNVVEKKEIVRILRMASSSVMNSPAFYTKNYDGNTITEKGRGAENEDFIVFYLSDGKIIKSSPKTNPEWMGTMVGEKVLKITGKKLSADRFETKKYYPLQNQMIGNKYWYHILTTAPGFHFEKYTTYQPLYDK